MSHPEFDQIGTADVKLVEECAELIKAIAKAWRFGWDSSNPLIEDSTNNREDVLSEIQDVRGWLDQLQYELTINGAPKINDQNHHR